ncbi:hypothetical protein DFJ63DRAFT_310292 [Scheffersomyces coipomensis]|uniref:uncharacterized protein n=1 Tax=Scheffersomyces coipomensis TaxID=1788519 RepID=UPI00315DF77F
MSKEESKFKNSSFHREGKKKNVTTNTTTSSTITEGSKSKNAEFISELVETGRPNWNKAPKAVRTRYNGVHLILLSIPIIFISTYELYRRLEGKSTKKVREGEIMENHEIRKYGEKEKWEVEKNSWNYKIFGKDFYLDGFTSKTMKRDSGNKPDESS